MSPIEAQQESVTLIVQVLLKHPDGREIEAPISQEMAGQLMRHAQHQVVLGTPALKHELETIDRLHDHHQEIIKSLADKAGAILASAELFPVIAVDPAALGGDLVPEAAL